MLLLRLYCLLLPWLLLLLWLYIMLLPRLLLPDILALPRLLLLLWSMLLLPRLLLWLWLRILTPWLLLLHILLCALQFLSPLLVLDAQLGVWAPSAWLWRVVWAARFCPVFNAVIMIPLNLARRWGPYWVAHRCSKLVLRRPLWPGQSLGP